MSCCLVRRVSRLGVCLALCSAALVSRADAASPLQTALNQSAEAGTFTVVVFHRDNGNATQALQRQASEGIATHADKATVVSARVDDPAERALVERFGLSRAPMPMAVVVAPNGAVTGLFPRAITKAQIDSAIVPPTMMRCMKELQQQKLVFVCLTREETEQATVPAAVMAFQVNPEFKDRISVVSMKLDDPAESRFAQQMKIDAAQVKGPYAVLIAPPGVLVGHFNALSSVEQITQALHKAGQCCNDPNCNHGHAPQAGRNGNNRR